MASRGKRRRSDGGSSGTDLTAKQLAEMAFDLAKVETRPGVAADLQEAYFHQLEEELFSRQRELNRLKDLLKHAGREGEPEIEDAVNLAEDAVEAQERKLADYLDARPWLLEKLYNSDQNSVDVDDQEAHSSEQDWRERLVAISASKELEWREELQKEQEKRVKAWRASEHERLQEQYEQLQRALLDRQEKLEKDWQQKLQGVEQAKLKGWMDEERRATEQLLSTEMERLRHEAQERENRWLRQLALDLETVEKELREQHKRELRMLEIEWREQEVLQRERMHLRKMEQEMLHEQRQRLEHQATQLRHELVQGQQQQFVDWLEQQTLSWKDTTSTWNQQICQQNAAALRKLADDYQQSLDRKSQQVLEQYTVALQSEQAQLREAFDVEYGAWLASQQEALLKTIDSWNKKHANRLSDLEENWQKLQADELKEKRSQWLQAFEGFASQLSEAQRRIVAEIQSDVRQQAELTLRQFTTQFAKAEELRQETWLKQGNSALERMHSQWQAERQAELQQWSELQTRQAERLLQLEQLLHEFAEQFALSQKERQNTWDNTSNNAIREVSARIEQYLQNRTDEALKSLDNQQRERVVFVDEQLQLLKQELLTELEQMQTEVNTNVSARLQDAIGEFEAKTQQVMARSQQLVDEWMHQADSCSQSLLTNWERTWTERSQTQLSEQTELWQAERVAEAEARSRHWTSIADEAQQKLETTQSSLAEYIHGSFNTHAEELNKAMQDLAADANSQVTQLLDQQQTRLEAELAQMQQHLLSNEEKRERVWQLNSSAALEVLDKRVSSTLSEQRLANDRSVAKWLAEQTSEFHRLAAELAKEHEKQSEGLLGLLQERMAESLRDITLEAQAQWSALFADWSGQQADSIASLGQHQHESLTQSASRWMAEQKEHIAAQLGQWQEQWTHMLLAQVDTWHHAQSEAKSSMDQARQTVIQELHQKVEKEVNLWLNQQVTRVEQVLHELLQIHRDELDVRERKWQELRDAELVVLHHQGNEKIVELARKWDETQQAARDQFEQRWLNELRTRFETVTSEWESETRQGHEQLQARVEQWQRDSWQQLQQLLLEELDAVTSGLTNAQQEQMAVWRATAQAEMQAKWQSFVEQWNQRYLTQRQEVLDELKNTQSEWWGTFSTEVRTELTEHSTGLSESLWLAQEERLSDISRRLLEQQRLAIEETTQWIGNQHSTSLSELSETIVSRQAEGFAELKSQLRQQVDNNLHKLEREVDTVLQEQLEQALKDIASKIDGSLEEIRAEMLDRYLQELTKNEQDLQARFQQHMDGTAEKLNEQFKQLWLQQAEEYGKLHESDLAEQQGRSLSRFEQSISLECQRLREQYEELISELREGIRSRQEADMKALQEAAYREYRTRLDQIVGELTSNHRDELAKVVQERDAKLVAEIRSNLKTEIQKQLEAERKQRLAKAASLTEPTRRSRRTRR